MSETYRMCSVNILLRVGAEYTFLSRLPMYPIREESLNIDTEHLFTSRTLHRVVGWRRVTDQATNRPFLAGYPRRIA